MKLHDLLRHDTAVHVEDIGHFHLCSSRLPWGRVKVSYSPAFGTGRWYRVPQLTLANGRLLLNAMIGADDAVHAVTLLSEAYALTQDPRAGKWAGQ